jgi:SAM-dependent methyltransferase
VTGRTPDFGGFSEVDDTGAAGAYAGYLDGVRGMDAVAEWKERSFDLLKPRPGAHLLDVGCGTGDDVLTLADRVRPGGRATGIDASAAMVDEARRRAGSREDVAFAVGDAAHLPLPEAAVDGCRAERTLQHVDRPDLAVAEMVRVTRPGGWVVAAEPDWATLVIDPADPKVTRAVAVAATERVRSGRVGRALRGLLVGAGLGEVGVAARTLVVTDRGAAETLLDIGGALARAVDGGMIPADRARAWTGEVDQAAAADRFLAALTAFMAWGRVPGGPPGAGRA